MPKKGDIGIWAQGNPKRGHDLCVIVQKLAAFKTGYQKYPVRYVVIFPNLESESYMQNLKIDASDFKKLKKV